MIGLFDSGFGGLTILKAFLEKLPEYDYLYLGDSGRAPYGNHTQETLLRYTRQGVEFLFQNGADLVVLACNAASSNALRALQEEMIRKPGVKDKNILGVVVPIAEAIAEKSFDRVAIIGTRATIRSGVYEKEIQNRRAGATFFTQACPLLVPLIEEGWAEKMETKRILKSYLRKIKTKHPQVLVPACTHYPILERDLKKIMGKNVEVLDTGGVVAHKLKDYLQRHPEIDRLLSKKGSRTFYTTDDFEKFRSLGSVFLGQPMSSLHQITLEP